MAEIDDVLAHHWAEVVLGAARADDPLAFGVERLRAARATYAWDLERLLGKIPPDRRGALARAEADLHRQEETLRHAQRRLRQGRDALDRAGERHWGRRDRAAVERAEANLAVAERDRQRCADAVAQAHQRVGTEGDAVRRWDSAMEETAWEQMRLHTAVADLDDALGATRAGRVAAAACDPTSDLQLSLGRPPHTGGGLAAWCGIAERVEAWRDHTATPTGRAEPCFGGDHHPVLGPRPPRGAGQSWDRLVALVDHAEELVAAASRAHPVPTGDERPHHREWEPAVEAAARAVAAERSVPAAEQSTGLSLGL